MVQAKQLEAETLNVNRSNDHFYTDTIVKACDIRMVAHAPRYLSLRELTLVTPCSSCQSLLFSSTITNSQVNWIQDPKCMSTENRTYFHIDFQSIDTDWGVINNHALSFLAHCLTQITKACHCHYIVCATWGR